MQQSKGKRSRQNAGKCRYDLLIANRGKVTHIRVFGLPNMEDQIFTVKGGRVQGPRRRQNERNVKKMIQDGSNGAPMQYQWRGRGPDPTYAKYAKEVSERDKAPEERMERNHLCAYNMAFQPRSDEPQDRCDPHGRAMGLQACFCLEMFELRG